MDEITDAINDLVLAIKNEEDGETTELQVQMLYALADIASAKVRYNNLVRQYNSSVVESDEVDG